MITNGAAAPAALHIKYRPEHFEDVLGQTHITKPLSGIIERRESQAFLFVGPSGTGKTTLARIAARNLGCDNAGIQELPAARYTGVDDMRAILDTLQYRPFGQSVTRAIILDEAHRLSRQAWDSLLKDVEEPPPHAYWFFCTTELGRIPTAIKTRTSLFNLKLVSDMDLTTLIKWVAKEERIKLPEGVLSVIVKQAQGSPRQALVNLSLCYNASDRKEAAAILQAVLETNATLELCQFVIGGRGSWTKAMAIVDKLQDESAEGLRIAVCNYVGAAIRKAKTDDEACKFLQILENFSIPFNPSEGEAPLLRSIGRTLFSG